MSVPTSTTRVQALNRRALLLACATVAYNLAEGVVAVAAGAAASSSALLGFGLDSLIEVASALAVLWQFRARLPESRERAALRLIAVSFFALAGYVTVESWRALLGAERPEPSPVGIGLAVASLVVMPTLAAVKRRTGRRLGSATVVADSAQTMLCTYLSAVLLVGLVVNAVLGSWWADPVAGLLIAALAVREGRNAWRGENCCAPVPAAGDGASDPACDDDCCHS